MVKTFFNGKRVLVTGDTGFKGSWLCLWLNELGAIIKGIALPPNMSQDHYKLLGLKELISHTDVDIRHLESVVEIFTSFQPEIVFHLAAQPLVRFSYEQPKLTFDTNVGGSVNILEAICQTPSVQALIYVTSDKCYKNKEWVWGYRENDELGGFDPYSASKAAAEIVFSSYMDSFFSERKQFGAASVRAGNVIGGGDWAKDRIVPDIVRSIIKEEPVFLRSPKAIRPWQHVLDPLYGYLLLAERICNDHKKYSGSWNFGPGLDSMKTVEDLAQAVIGNWGKGEVQTAIDSSNPHETNVLYLNCDKAKNLLGWRSVWNFEKTVAETVYWYKGSSNKAAIEMSQNQIRKYMEELQ